MTQQLRFSMFDPVVAYDAISNNWINVAEAQSFELRPCPARLQGLWELRAQGLIPKVWG